ncbi:MAG TPA: polysaccharide deacetylase family protein, partial [Roseiflexaceae bacterium]
GPLCVLAAGAPGEELQIEALESALGEAARAGRIKLRVVRDVTPATLERALMEGPVHILHVAAPVALTERRAARLLLRRGADMFDLSELVAGQRDLRLVTLTGPQGDAASIGATLPALAATLLTADLPATIAFGGPLPARQSARFAAVCYGQLASGAPIDLAVTTARRALAESAGGRGWGLAQLRLAPGGEQIFALRGRPRRAPVRLPRPALVAGAGVALIAAFLLGSRAIGARHPAATAAQALAPTSAITTVTQALAPSGAAAPTALPTVTVEATETPKSSGGLLAALFGAPSTPTAIPEPPAPPAPTAAPAPSSYAAFLTGPNDTPESIAQRMGSDAAAIAALNHLDSHAPLRTARPLVIPVYRPGEPGNGGLVINRGNPAERKVALTFDIEIDDSTLYGFLDVLHARGIHGTFFVTGRWVQAFPDAARAIVKDGHEIGNHSLTHPFFSRIGLDGVAAELQETEQVVQETTGATTRPYFRYPYGDYTADTTAVVASQGFVAYHWSADDNGIASWLDRVAQNPADGNGAILLMHGRAESVAALPGWLDRLAALGLQPTTLGDTLR